MGLSTADAASGRPPRFVLGIDTATRTASVGLLDGDTLVAERSLPGSRSLATVVLPMVQEVLDAAGRSLAEVELIAVSLGPGSFTGLRIGLSVVKGFALTTGCDVVGVPTLHALALVAGPMRGLICPVLDARKGEVYAALFRADGGGLLRIAEDCATTPARLAAAIDEPCVVVGDGVEVLGDEFRRLIGSAVEFLPFAEFHPRGGAVASLGRRRHREMGADSLAGMVPRYCRVSEAEAKRLAGEEAGGRRALEG